MQLDAQVLTSNQRTRKLSAQTTFVRNGCHVARAPRGTMENYRLHPLSRYDGSRITYRSSVRGFVGVPHLTVT